MDSSKLVVLLGHSIHDNEIKSFFLIRIFIIYWTDQYPYGIYTYWVIQ